MDALRLSFDLSTLSAPAPHCPNSHLFSAPQSSYPQPPLLRYLPPPSLWASGHLSDPSLLPLSSPSFRVGPSLCVSDSHSLRAPCLRDSVFLEFLSAHSLLAMLLLHSAASSLSLGSPVHSLRAGSLPFPSQVTGGSLLVLFRFRSSASSTFLDGPSFCCEETKLVARSL